MRRSRKKRTRRPTASNNGASSVRRTSSVLNKRPVRLALKVRHSPVHGRGVFTKMRIGKGARIIEYTGRRILWSSIPDELDEERTYYFGLDNEKEVIDPTVGGNEARWINHSCNPNCETREDTQERVFIHALRNIRAGEELFYDYRLAID